MDQALHLRRMMAGDYSTSVAQCMRQQFSTGRPRIVAVTSGKGGVGKTTLAVNLAITLAEIPSRVLLIDADLGLANVDVMLGIAHDGHLGNLLSGGVEPEEIAFTGPRDIKVISGGSGLRELADASTAERALLINKLEAYCEEFDYVVIDTSPGIGADVADFVRMADEALVVTTPEPTSMRDTYAALKAISCAMPDKSVTPVVNSASEAQASRTVEAMNQVMDAFLKRKCLRWHQIEADPLVARTIKDRRPLMCAFPKSPAAICITKIAKKIAERETVCVLQ